MAVLTNSEYGTMIIKEGNEERDEKYNGYVVNAKVDNKVVSSIALRNDFLSSNKIKIIDVVINLNKGDISTEKGVIRNYNTSTKDHLGTSNQTRNISLHLKNRNNNPIVRKDTSAKINDINIVYNEKNDIMIPLTNIEMATSDKS